MSKLLASERRQRSFVSGMASPDSSRVVCAIMPDGVSLRHSTPRRGSAGPTARAAAVGRGVPRQLRSAQPQPLPRLQREPVLGGELQDSRVLPSVLRPLRLDPRRPRLLHRVLRSLQPRPPPRRHRAAHPGIGPLRHRRRDPRPARPDPPRRLRRQPGPIPTPPAPTTETTHRRLDQRTHTRSTHQIRIGSCLTGLDPVVPSCRPTVLAPPATALTNLATSESAATVVQDTRSGRRRHRARKAEIQQIP